MRKEYPTSVPLYRPSLVLTPYSTKHIALKFHCMLFIPGRTHALSVLEVLVPIYIYMYTDVWEGKMFIHQEGIQ